ncbi:MAG TPA: DUF3052 family protein [Gemmatimonadota bacterium]|nr:DUF3052 family protein [Gemmatimonadota bacterium]
MNAEKSYADRDVLDKLGIRDGMRIRLSGAVPAQLRERIAGRDAVDMVLEDDAQPVNLVLVALDEGSASRAAFAELRRQIVPDGAVWALTPKRGSPGYVKQESLIPLGKGAGLVDNKICSVDDATSAIRFVIPVAQRERPGTGAVH